MIAFVKRKKDFKTVVCAEAIAWDVPLASIENDVGSITLFGTAVTRGHEGDFLIMGGHIWLIDQVSPEEQQTTVSVIDIRYAFDRLLPYTEAQNSIGGWIANQLEVHYKFVSDEAYAMPYLLVTNTDVTEYLGPNIEDGLYSLKSYMRKVNRLRDIQVQFSVSQDNLLVQIYKRTRPTHNILFDDGKAQLVSRVYSRSSVAKVTAYQNGAGTDYYLSSNGKISKERPLFRADGIWKVISLDPETDMDESVKDLFSQNSNSHKIEWLSQQVFDLYDTIYIRLDGGIMNSYVSYIGISSAEVKS